MFDEAGLHWLGQLHTHHLGDGEEGGALLTDMSTGAQSVSVISLQPHSPHRLSTVLTRVTRVSRVTMVTRVSRVSRVSRVIS